MINKLIAIVTKESRKLEQRQQEMKLNKLRVHDEDSELSEIIDDEAAFVQKGTRRREDSWVGRVGSLLATLQCTAPPKLPLESPAHTTSQTCDGAQALCLRTA